MTEAAAIVQTNGAPLAATAEAAARKLAGASVSANTRRAYAGALTRLDAWLNGRPLEDATLAGYLADLHAADIEPAASVPGAVPVRVRRSKTDQAAERADVRMVKNGPAAAVLTLADGQEPDARIIPLTGQQIARRLAAAAGAAGIERHLTGHSGRVGLASKLTARGASTTDAMLAGGWKTTRMVAHYSAGAKAERGAVARFL